MFDPNALEVMEKRCRDDDNDDENDDAPDAADGSSESGSSGSDTHDTYLEHSDPSEAKGGWIECALAESELPSLVENKEWTKSLELYHCRIQSDGSERSHQTRSDGTDRTSSSSDDETESDDSEGNLQSYINNNGGIAKIKLSRHRAHKYRKVMRRAQMVQIQQRELHERSKKRAVHILVTLLDRTEPNGVLPSIHRYNSSSPFSNVGPIPTIDAAGIVELRPSDDADDLRRLVFQPNDCVEFIPTDPNAGNNDNDESENDDDGDDDGEENDNGIIRKSFESCRVASNYESCTDTLLSDGITVVPPRLFLGKKQRDLKAAGKKENQKLLHLETFFTVADLARYLAVMMYIFGSECKTSDELSQLVGYDVDSIFQPVLFL